MKKFLQNIWERGVCLLSWEENIRRRREELIRKSKDALKESERLMEEGWLDKEPDESRSTIEKSGPWFPYDIEIAPHMDMSGVFSGRFTGVVSGTMRGRFKGTGQPSESGYTAILHLRNKNGDQVRRVVVPDNSALFVWLDAFVAGAISSSRSGIWNLPYSYSIVCVEHLEEAANQSWEQMRVLRKTREETLFNRMHHDLKEKKRVPEMWVYDWQDAFREEVVVRTAAISVDGEVYSFIPIMFLSEYQRILFELFPKKDKSG